MYTTEHDAVVLTVGDRTYTYLADMAALIKAERAMSADEDRLVVSREIVLGAAMGSNRHTRFLLWAALQRHHPDVTLDQATEILSTLGGTDQLMELLTKLRASTMPDKEDAPKDRPQEARQATGTGAPATSSPDALASMATVSGD